MADIEILMITGSNVSDKHTHVFLQSSLTVSHLMKLPYVPLFGSNPQMLRTCSLPDLSRLFGVQQSSAVTDTGTAPDSNLETEDLDEAAKDEEQSENEE